MIINIWAYMPGTHTHTQTDEGTVNGNCKESFRVAEGGEEEKGVCVAF